MAAAACPSGLCGDCSCDCALLSVPRRLKACCHSCTRRVLSAPAETSMHHLTCVRWQECPAATHFTQHASLSSACSYLSNMPLTCTLLEHSPTWAQLLLRCTLQLLHCCPLPRCLHTLLVPGVGVLQQDHVSLWSPPTPWAAAAALAPAAAPCCVSSPAPSAVPTFLCCLHRCAHLLCPLVRTAQVARGHHDHMWPRAASRHLQCHCRPPAMNLSHHVSA